MRVFVTSLVAWSLIVFAITYLYPFGTGDLLPCGRLVGRWVACEAGQATVNEAVFRYRTLPLLAWFIAGYAGIFLVRIRGRRRQRASNERLERPKAKPSIA